MKREAPGPGKVEDSAIDNPEASHEKSDVRLKGIVIFGAALFVAAIVIHVAVWLLFIGFGRLNPGAARDFPQAAGQTETAPPAPRLQEKPREEMKALNRQDENLLATYGWVDPEIGTVRIPIDEAMQRVLLMELPADADGDPAARYSLRPSDSASGRVVETERR